jgi:GNAT superfamily N-acetyltransferase
VEDLFVLPEHRGKGYGRALMIHLAKIAEERDAGV